MPRRALVYATNALRATGRPSAVRRARRAALVTMRQQEVPCAHLVLAVLLLPRKAVHSALHGSCVLWVKAWSQRAVLHQIALARHVSWGRAIRSISVRWLVIRCALAQQISTRAQHRRRAQIATVITVQLEMLVMVVTVIHLANMATLHQQAGGHV